MNLPKIGRKTAYRDRTVRNLVTSLVLYEKVTTTEGKAKLMRPMMERLITRARKNEPLTARRYAKSLLFDEGAVRKLFEDLALRYGTRESGFVRLTKCPPRAGDGAAMIQVELLVTPLEDIIAKETGAKTKVRKVSNASKESSKAAPELTPETSPVINNPDED